jgi:uncharacterized protein YpmB
MTKLSLKEFKAVKGLRFSHKEVAVLVPVEKFTEKSLKIKISVDSLAERIQLQTFPKEVEAIFLVPLSKYHQLEAPLLEAKVSVNEVKERLKKLPVELLGVPPYARLLRIEPNRVEYIIRE